MNPLTLCSPIGKLYLKEYYNKHNQMQNILLILGSDLLFNVEDL